MEKESVFTDATLSKERANAGLPKESKLYNALNHKDDPSDQPREYGQHGTTSSLLHSHYNPGAEMIMVIIIACTYANSIFCGLDHFFP